MDKEERNAQIRKLYKELYGKGLRPKKAAEIIQRELHLEHLTLRTILIYTSGTYEKNRRSAIKTKDRELTNTKYFCPRKDDEGEPHSNKWVQREGSTAYCGAVDGRGKKCFYTFVGTGTKHKPD